MRHALSMGCLISCLLRVCSPNTHLPRRFLREISVGKGPEERGQDRTTGFDIAVGRRVFHVGLSAEWHVSTWNVVS
jgi:hypothetical protein